MVYIFQALKLPFRSWKSFVLGVVLYLVPLLNALTGLFVIGYACCTAKNVLKGSWTLPSWEFKLVIDGLRAMAVSLLWFAPLAVPIMLLAWDSISAVFLSGFVGEFVFTPSFIIITVLFALWSYMIPSALMNLVSEDSFRGGFDFQKILSRAFTPRYFLGWLQVAALYLVFNLVLGALVGVATILDLPGVIVGYLLGGILGYLGVMVSFTVYATVWVPTVEKGSPTHVVSKRSVQRA